MLQRRLTFEEKVLVSLSKCLSVNPSIMPCIIRECEKAPCVLNWSIKNWNFDNGKALFNKTSVKKCLNTNIYSYLETYGGQSSNPYLNVHFFKHQFKLDIYGILRQWFPCIGVYYMFFYCRVSVKNFNWTLWQLGFKVLASDYLYSTFQYFFLVLTTGMGRPIE
jgi:hypothetical protein